MDLEQQKKQVVPYLQRAEEVQAVDPKVAYYCRLWAVDQALRIGQRHKEIDGLLHAVLAQLEKDKPKVAPLDPEADRYHCENFAANIFRRANRVDRAGRANADTARAFWAASVFYDVLNQFGDLEPDLFEKQRYAAWRAAEINKAVREGRPPVPPPAAPPGTGGAADDDLFGKMPGMEDAAAPPPPPAAGGGAGAAAPPAPPGEPNWGPLQPPAAPAAPSGVSSLFDLPAPPTGEPPLPPPGPPPPPAPPGPAPAAYLGPRFRQGARVLHAAAPGGAPEPGTVGMVVSAAGQDPMYKVAFRDRLAEVPDSALAPDVGAGGRVAFVEAAGAAGVGATVLAASTDAWPPSYLLRCDNGRDVPAAYGQVTLALDVDSSPQQQHHAPPPPPQPQPPRLPGPKDLLDAAAHAAATVAAAVRAGAPPPAARPPPPAAAPAAPAAAPSAVQIPAPVPGYQPPLQAIQDAQKAAKYAVSSLSFDDVAGAVKYLSDALRLLTQPGAGKP